MSFKSERQRRFLYAKKPQVARRFAHRSRSAQSNIYQSQAKRKQEELTATQKAEEKEAARLRLQANHLAQVAEERRRQLEEEQNE